MSTNLNFFQDTNDTTAPNLNMEADVKIQMACIKIDIKKQTKNVKCNSHLFFEVYFCKTVH